MTGPNTNSGFPQGFVWGAATASYQIEGAPDADGKGENIWDRFCRVPGAIFNGDTGDRACEHYYRWREDVGIMSEIGLQAYRYSISWARILPEGRGTVNTSGLDFYDRLTDGLMEAGITPYVTLYHWDLPQALQSSGGWANRDTAHHFSAYAERVADRLGDRVKHWITHNEPAVVAFHGNLTGEHAPGIRNRRTAFQVSHHLLLSHGLAVQALRGIVPGAELGITLNLYPIHPASDQPEDQQAARAHDGVQNRWFLDPLYRGAYPQDVLELLGDNAPEVAEGDMQTISAPLDMLGVNYYSRSVVRHSPENHPLFPAEVKPEGSEYTDMGWEIYPDGLREILVRLHNEYPTPALYVTENGAAYPDAPGPGGRVNDTRRISYLEKHFDAAAQAVGEGVPLKGYFVWSLMDNFEWAWGYSKRFGIVFVDYSTQKRTPKDSARWYREWIASQR